jgi:hypothetical protein
MNEWYARDTSKKIRSAYQAKNLAGKHTSSAVPYGYRKNKDNKDLWLIDEEAAAIVRRIYDMTMEGMYIELDNGRTITRPAEYQLDIFAIWILSVSFP